MMSRNFIRYYKNIIKLKALYYLNITITFISFIIKIILYIIIIRFY
jgi:hypothetical protein